jgi:hypothetical protein
MGEKLKERKKRDKKSDVYLEGRLMPPKLLGKEICRQGYMTSAEHIEMEQSKICNTVQSVRS